MDIHDAERIIDAKDHLIKVLEKELASARAENDLLKRETFSLRTRLDSYKYQSGKRRFYSPDEIAGILNLSKTSVINYMKKGLLKHTTFEDPEGIRKTYRISESDFCDFIGACPEKVFSE